MPSLTDDDEVPFDARRTPCMGMGVVANTFWRMPGVLRSDSPHGPACPAVPQSLRRCEGSSRLRFSRQRGEPMRDTGALFRK